MESMRRDMQNKEYLQENVNPILEPMVVEIVKHKPQDIVIESSYLIAIQVKFIFKFLTDNYGDRIS